jgi:glycosyltransferase involved in cell wall biosynthesis
MDAELNKIKIFYIFSHLPQGGTERQFLNLIKGLDFNLFEITLVLYLKNEVFYNEVKDLPIKILYKSNYHQNKYINYISTIYFLKKILANESFDILHTALFHNGFFVRLFMPKKYNNKIIYSLRNNLQDFNSYELFFERLLLKKTIVIANSKLAMKQYNNQIAFQSVNKASYIYNGIDTSKFNLKEVIINKIIKIGSVGRQAIQKNHMQILRALNSKGILKKFNFYLIGSKGDKTDEINDYILKNNLLHKFFNLGVQQDIESYYNDFDIFILSSLYEGCPNVLFEAMLSKCICIVSRQANSDNFIVDGVNGLIYDGTDDMLKKKINEAVLILDSNMSYKMLSSAEDYVKNNFANNIMVEKYEYLYKKLMR